MNADGHAVESEKIKNTRKRKKKLGHDQGAVIGWKKRLEITVTGTGTQIRSTDTRKQTGTEVKSETTDDEDYILVIQNRRMEPVFEILSSL